MIRLGIIGTSLITEQFLEAALLTKKYKVSAIYSRTNERGKTFGKKYDCENIFTSYEEMAKSDLIDAVYIASPNKLHVEQSEIFLLNNKHVLCEKPITTSAKEYLSLKNLADKNNLIYMEAIMPIFTEDREIIKNAIKEISPVSLARIDFSQRSSKLDAFLSGKYFTVFDKDFCGGALMDLGVYCIYAAIDLFGEPSDVVSHSHFHNGNGVDMSGNIILKYKDFSVSLTYSKVGQSTLGSEIIGQNGSIKIDSISMYTGIHLLKGKTLQTLSPVKDRTFVMEKEALRFYDYINFYDDFSEDYKEKSDLCHKVRILIDKIRSDKNEVRCC
ncbi:MAG: Gfo/Idh/MocA family oxidoreductase [Clostridia bacterium]|nr:Gfo/Idh/MocA family oxidoreductase [Clostridia bacterium]